jgi:hypothetical protein
MVKSRLDPPASAQGARARATAVRVLPLSALLALAWAVPAFAHSKPPVPAGGGAIDQVIGGTVVSLALIAGMVFMSVKYRHGRANALRKLGALAERRMALPAWAALPLAVQGISLIVAVFGMYWDISIHLDEGRDAGPFANAAHYFILVGLFGIVFAGLLAVVLPEGRRPGRSAVKVPKGGWSAPVGGALILLCGLIALSGFPLDDIWHRIFGQDVTLWGPTHLLLFGAASLSVIGGLLLYEEGRRAADQTSERPEASAKHFRRLGPVVLCGALLIGLSTFQGEFDYSVPQFRLVLHPVMLMLASSVALVAARVYFGRWGALLAVGFFILIRGALTLIVSGIAGHTLLHLPFYLVEAAVIELVALRAPVRRPAVFGLMAGAAVGTVGLASEWALSQVWWVVTWPSALFPEGAVAGSLTALAGGVLGAHIGGALRANEPHTGFRAKVAPIVAGLTIVGVAVWSIPISPPPPVSATVQLTEVTPPPERQVQATVALNPPNAAEDPMWFMSTAWQGVEHRTVVEKLHPVGPGVYRTRAPITVHGNWKASIRLADDSWVAGLPVYFPFDPSIPAAEIPAAAAFTREFVDDKTILLREQLPGVPGVLKVFAYVTVALIAVLLIASLVMGLRRFQVRNAGVMEPVEARDPLAAGAEG